MRFGKLSYCSFLAAARPAEIHVYDVIGSGGIFSDGGITAKDIAAALKECEGASSLSVYINSPGGNFDEGIAIHSQLKRFPGQKTVHVDGLAASVASVIALAGDRISSAPGARWMIHEARTFQGGKAADMRKTAEALDLANDVMASAYAERTKKPKDEIRRLMDQETWFTASEAKDFGLSDEIAGQQGQGRASAHIDHPIFAFFTKTPEALRATAHTPADPAPPSKEPVMLKQFALLLGLAESASEQDILAAFTKSIQSARASSEQTASLLSLTGKTTAAEATGVIQAWKQDAEKLPAMSSKIAEIEAKAQADKVEQLIATAKTEHRITPADEPKAREFLKAHGFAAFSAYVAMLHPVVPAGETPEKKVITPTSAPAQAAIFKHLGVAPTAAK